MNGFVNGVLNFLLVLCTKLGTNLLILDCVPHVVSIILQRVLGLNLLFVLFIFRLVLLSFLNHLLYFVLRQPTLGVGDSDLVLLADTSLICEPDFYRVDADRLLTRDCVQARGEAFLKSSIAPVACA